VAEEDGTEQVLLGEYQYRHEGQRLRLSWLDPADGSEKSAGEVPVPLESASLGFLAAIDADHLYLTGDVDWEMRLRAFER
jgi:hypothetical protein